MWLDRRPQACIYSGWTTRVPKVVHHSSSTLQTIHKKNHVHTALLCLLVYLCLLLLRVDTPPLPPTHDLVASSIPTFQSNVLTCHVSVPPGFHSYYLAHWSTHKTQPQHLLNHSQTPGDATYRARHRPAHTTILTD